MRKQTKMNQSHSGGKNLFTNYPSFMYILGKVDFFLDHTLPNLPIRDLKMFAL